MSSSRSRSIYAANHLFFFFFFFLWLLGQAAILLTYACPGDVISFRQFILKRPPPPRSLSEYSLHFCHTMADCLTEYDCNLEVIGARISDGWPGVGLKRKGSGRYVLYPIPHTVQTEMVSANLLFAHSKGRLFSSKFYQSKVLIFAMRLQSVVLIVIRGGGGGGIRRRRRKQSIAKQQQQ